MTHLQLFALCALPLCVACGHETVGGASSEDPQPDAGHDATPPGADTEPTPDADTGPAPEASLHYLMDREAVSVSDWISAPVQVQVPPGAISMAIVVEGQDQESYTVSDWTDETGFTHAAADWWGDDVYECLECNTTVSWLRGVFVAVAPDNPQSLVHSGAHSFRIEGSVQREEVRVTVMVRTAPDVPSAGVIDLHLYFTGAYDWSADAAPQTQYFRDVMDRVEEVWEPMGLRIGEMTFTDLDPAYQNVENAWGPGNDLDALLAQSGSQTTGALNVFFVDELYVGDSREPREADPIIGISAAPGPPRVDGTISSGIVVSTWSTLSVPEAERWPNALAHTIAHEAGHYFGLRHTTEFDGVTHDRLEDTPEGDRGNLMHADPDPERGTLSPWQARIILGNMLVAPP